MTALPSIVAGLFIYATLILILGFNKSGFAAALAISVMMLPIIIRAVGRGAAAGAGQPAGGVAARWARASGGRSGTSSLPTARSGLATAVILGTARGIGETSPVLLTAGYTATLNADPLHGPQVSLPLLTFKLVRSAQPAYIARGFGAGAVLMLLVLVLFVVARLIGGRGAGQLSRRQQRRRAAASRRDVRRYAETGAAAAGIEPPAPGRPDSSVHSGGMS